MKKTVKTVKHIPFTKRETRCACDALRAMLPYRPRERERALILMAGLLPMTRFRKGVSRGT
jgi:hypothetical protein